MKPIVCDRVDCDIAEEDNIISDSGADDDSVLLQMNRSRKDAYDGDEDTVS